MVKEVIKNPNEKEWKALEKGYGKAKANKTKNPLKEKTNFFGQRKAEIDKTLTKTEEEIPKGKEPYLFLQLKNGITKHYEEVTTGVFNYQGSDGIYKKIWLSQKYISTLTWGDKTLRYYNCTEDYPIPHGLNDMKELATTIEQLINKMQLDHEKLRTSEIKAQAKATDAMFMGIVKIILALGAIIFVPMLFGFNIFDMIGGSEGTETIKEVIKQNISNTTQQMGNITILK